MMPAPPLPRPHGSLRQLQSGGHAAAAMDSPCMLHRQSEVRRRLAWDSRQQLPTRFTGSSQRRQHCVTQAAHDQRQRQHAQLRPPRQAPRPSKSHHPAPWHLLAHQRSPWQRACSGRSAAAAADGIPAEASDAPGQQEAQAQQPRLSPAEDAALAGTLTLDSSIDDSVDVFASHSADGSRPEADPSLGLAKRRDSLRRSLRYLCFTCTMLTHSHATQSMLVSKTNLNMRQ
jgi:hypothetical protein